MNEAVLLSETNKKIVGTLKIINIVFCALLLLGSIIVPLSIGNSIVKTAEKTESVSENNEDSFSSVYSSNTDSDSKKMNPILMIILISVVIAGVITAGINYFIVSAFIQHYINVAEMNYIKKLESKNLISALNDTNEEKEL